jgi:hypothetical protein
VVEQVDTLAMVVQVAHILLTGLMALVAVAVVDQALVAPVVAVAVA